MRGTQHRVYMQMSVVLSQNFKNIKKYGSKYVKKENSFHILFENARRLPPGIGHYLDA